MRRPSSILLRALDGGFDQLADQRWRHLVRRPARSASMRRDDGRFERRLVLFEIQRDLLVAHTCASAAARGTSRRRQAPRQQGDAEAEDRRRAEAQRLEGIGGADQRDGGRGEEPDSAPQRSFTRQRFRTWRMTSRSAARGSPLFSWWSIMPPTKRFGRQLSASVLLHAFARDSRCARSDSPVRSRIPANSRYHQSRCERSCASSGRASGVRGGPGADRRPATAADDFGRIHGCSIRSAELDVARGHRDQRRLSSLLADLVKSLLAQFEHAPLLAFERQARAAAAPARRVGATDRPPATGR